VTRFDPCDDPSIRAGLADQAAQRFIDEHLELVGQSNPEKEALYICPFSGQSWLADLSEEPSGRLRLRIVHEDPSWYSGTYQGWQPEPLPEGWEVLPNEVRRTFEDELKREVTPGHPLYSQTVVAIARCTGCEDVLFSIEGRYVRWTVVHLTFARGPQDPPLPMSEEFDAFGEARRRLADHRH